MLHTSLENDLLLALFAAANGDPNPAAVDPLWQNFLSKLQAATTADTACLQLALNTGARLCWGHEAARLNADQQDPMRDNRVYSQIDLPGAPPDLGPLRAIKWQVGALSYGSLILRRDGQDFRAVDSSRLSSLLPFLGRALANWLALRDERRGHALDLALGAGLKTGWILLSPSGTLIQQNPTARALIEAHPAVAVRSQGVLALSDPEAARQLRHALLTLSPDAPIAVELSRSPRLEVRLSATQWHHAPGVLGILRQEPNAQALPLINAARHFGLSRSEMRLAALLCDGFSLKDAAQALGWTLETARSGSKQIFARTGTTGQTDLIRLLLTSTVWLEVAPDGAPMTPR